MLTRIVVTLSCKLAVAVHVLDVSKMEAEVQGEMIPQNMQPTDMMAQAGQFMADQAKQAQKIMTSFPNPMQITDSSGQASAGLDQLMDASDWAVNANSKLLSTSIEQMEAMMGNVVKFNEDILQDDNVAKTVGFKKLGNQMNERLKVATHTMRALTEQARDITARAAAQASDIGRRVAKNGFGSVMNELQAAHQAGTEYSKGLLAVAHTAQNSMNSELQLATSMAKQSMTEAMDSVKSQQVKDLVTKSTQALDAISSMMTSLMGIQQKAEQEVLDVNLDSMLVVAKALQAEAAALDAGSNNMQKFMALSKVLQDQSLAANTAKNLQAASTRYIQSAAAEMQKFGTTMRSIFAQGDELKHAQQIFSEAMSALTTMMEKQQRDSHHSHDDHHH